MAVVWIASNSQAIAEANPIWTGVLPESEFTGISSVVISARIGWDLTAEGRTGKMMYLYWWIYAGLTADGNGTLVKSTSSGASEISGSTGYVDVSTSASSLASLNLPTGPYHIMLQPIIVTTPGNWQYQGAAKYIDVYIYNYASPQLPSMAAQRCDVDGSPNVAGEHAKLDIAWAVAPVGDYNNKSLIIKWREQGTETWTGSETIDVSALNYSDALTEYVLDGTFNTGKKYDIQAELTDRVSTVTNIKTLQSAGAVFHLSGDKRHIAFHKRCEPGEDAPGIDFGGELPGYFRVAPEYADPAAAREALGIGLLALGIQMGKISTTLPIENKKSGKIVFDHPYTAPPLMCLTLEYNNTASINTVFKIFVSDISETEFTWHVDSSGGAAHAIKLHWAALGTLAPE